jgi:hypothetical protein
MREPAVSLTHLVCTWHHQASLNLNHNITKCGNNVPQQGIRYEDESNLPSQHQSITPTIHLEAATSIHA